MFGWKRRVDSRLDELQLLLNRIDVALLIRDPGSSRSAEAFEGLRKAVVASGNDRRRHLVQLVLLADSLERGASIETLRARTEEWLSQAGVTRWTDPEPREFFEVIGGSGPVARVETPAWIEASSEGTRPTLVKTGTVTLHAGTEPHSPEQSPIETVEVTVSEPPQSLTDEQGERE